MTASNKQSSTVLAKELEALRTKLANVQSQIEVKSDEARRLEQNRQNLLEIHVSTASKNLRLPASLTTQQKPIRRLRDQLADLEDLKPMLESRIQHCEHRLKMRRIEEEQVPAIRKGHEEFLKKFTEATNVLSDLSLSAKHLDSLAFLIQHDRLHQHCKLKELFTTGTIEPLDKPPPHDSDDFFADARRAFEKKIGREKLAVMSNRERQDAWDFFLKTFRDPDQTQNQSFLIEFLETYKGLDEFLLNFFKQTDLFLHSVHTAACRIRYWDRHEHPRRSLFDRLHD